MANPNEARKTICSKGWAVRLPRVFALLAAALWLTSPARAQQASDGLLTEPVLRIETGLQHGAPILRIDTDAENRFAVTASFDKTVRLWSLPDGKLLRIFRLPLGPGNIGKAYAVAISPDGSTIAAGGWTGSPGRSKNIFLFHRATGELKQRLPDLPNVIHHLAFSPDGQRLAASLGGSNGIRVFDVGKGYEPLPSDANYKDQSYRASFDQAGRLVTACYDGFVRLYAADHYDQPVKQFRLEGHRPSSVAFSPDGKRVAVGYEDTPKVVVLSGSDLTKLFEADTSGIPDVGLIALGWSQDGRFLFAGGHWKVNGVWQIRRWSEGGKRPSAKIPAGSDTIMEILGLKSGSMLFAHQEGFGLISPDAKVKQLQGFGALALNSGGGHKLAVSRDGTTVQVDSWEPPHSYRFSLGERRIDTDPPADKSLAAPVKEAPGLHVTNWDSSTTPAVNGTPLRLQPYEIARSLAIVPGTKQFVLGAQWWLRLLDQQANEVWQQPVPGEAWHVNVTGDGRLVVAAYGDGTIRWLRLSDGEELLALFIHPDAKRWVAWTPQGYYDASVGGDELIGWQVNHGYDQAPDFFPAARFRDQFNRPDIVALVLKTLDVDEAVRQANGASGRKAAAPVGDSLPPVVTIVSPPDLSSVANSPIEVYYQVRSPTPVTGVTVQVDGRPVATAPPKEIGSGKDGTVASVSIDMPQHDAVISLVAANEKASSEPAVVHIGWQGAKDWYKPDLYVLAIGVSQYKDKKLNLIYPDKDAEDFVKVMKEQEGGLYKNVYVHKLPDDRATRDEIRKGLNWLKKSTTSRDIAVLFLSGHGQNDAGGHYHYLPYDTDMSDLDFTTIQDYEIEDFLDKVPGKVIAFLDTCFSGGLQAKGPTQPDINKLANELASAEKGVVVFTSSTGRQFSLEKPEWHNGAFTKALVEALQGGADFEHDKSISIAALELYLAQRVKKLTDGEQSPASLKPKTIENFVIATVVP
jgi:WD40 repeat protein